MNYDSRSSDLSPPNRLTLKQRPYPQYIKYMGSKSKIMDFVLSGINEVYQGGGICDLFAGSASLAGAIGDQVSISSNDIQNYSATLSKAYLLAWRSSSSPDAEKIIDQAQHIFDRNKREIGWTYNYADAQELDKFQLIEEQEREFIDVEFTRGWHLFLKYYSGTWWSAEQALWIDAIREVADSYQADPAYDVILSSLMFAMAYASQGTGHYAQYRVANTVSSMRDISIYR
ncbi:MAG: DNA adenine methylase, partial [Anaerolineales bacterium]